MNRNSLIVSVLLNIGLVAFVAYQYKSGFGNAVQHEHAKRVAILTPTTHPSLEQIEHGFCQTLTKEGKQHYDIKVFNAQGDRKLMHAQAEEIVHGDYDLVFTIATGPSAMIHELLVKRGKKVPQVFGAVSDPVGVGLVTSLTHPEGDVTGSVERPEFEHQIELLKTIKPDTAKILLVYNPTQGSGLVKEKEEVEAVLKSHNIALATAEVVNIHEIYGKTAGVIADCDVVMVLKDSTVVAGLDALVKLCNAHHKPLLTTDLDSCDRGAALSFGVYENQFGVQAARYAHDILENNKKIVDLPCVSPDAYKLKINLKAADLQGLALTDAQKAIYPVVEAIQG